MFNHRNDGTKDFYNRNSYFTATFKGRGDRLVPIHTGQDYFLRIMTEEEIKCRNPQYRDCIWVDIKDPLTLDHWSCPYSNIHTFNKNWYVG